MARHRSSFCPSHSAWQYTTRRFSMILAIHLQYGYVGACRIRRPRGRRQTARRMFFNGNFVFRSSVETSNHITRRYALSCLNRLPAPPSHKRKTAFTVVRYAPNGNRIVGQGAIVLQNYDNDRKKDQGHRQKHPASYIYTAQHTLLLYNSLCIYHKSFGVLSSTCLRQQ